VPAWLAVAGLLAYSWAFGAFVATRGQRRAFWALGLFQILALWALIQAAS
jgi:hypothetical protein